MKKRDGRNISLILLIVILIVLLFYFITQENIFLKSPAGAPAKHVENRVLIPEVIMPSYPDYLGIQVDENSPIYSGDRIHIEHEVFLSLRESDIARIELHGPKTIKLKLRKFEDKTLVVDTIPRELPSGDYQIRLITKKGIVYIIPLYIHGVIDDVYFEKEGKEKEIQYSPPEVSLRHSRTGNDYWELAIAGNPDNSLQLITGASSQYSRSLDGGLTWTRMTLQNPSGSFRGDPKISVTSNGRIVLTGLSYQILLSGLYPTTGVVYTGNITGTTLLGRLFKIVPDNYVHYGSDVVVDRPNMKYDPIKDKVFIIADDKYSPSCSPNCGVLYGTTLFESASGYIYHELNQSFIESEPAIYYSFLQFDLTSSGKPRFVNKVPFSFGGKVNHTVQYLRVELNSTVSGISYIQAPEIKNSVGSDPQRTELCIGTDTALCDSTSQNRTHIVWTGPEIIIDKYIGSPTFGRTYVVWSQPELFYRKLIGTVNYDLGMNYDVYYSYSDDDGNGWTVPKKVNNDNVKADQNFPSVSLSKDGVVHVVFYDKRNYPNASFHDVYYAPIKDGKVITNVKINADSSCALASDKTSCSSIMSGNHICSWIFNQCRDSIPNRYGGRNNGDYMDSVVAYSDNVYIAYPCMNTLSLPVENPNEICVTSFDPRPLYLTNLPPEFTGLQDYTAVAFQPLKFFVQAFDFNKDQINITARSTPSSFSLLGINFTDFRNGTALFNWTPSESQVGKYTITFNVTDGQEQQTQNISIEVKSSGIKTRCDQCLPAVASFCTRSECESLPDPKKCYAVDVGPIYCLECTSATNCSAYGNDIQACQKNNCGFGLGTGNGCLFINNSCENCNDADRDSICDKIDNCPVANFDQLDSDEDGIGNACDAETCGNENIEGNETCDDGLQNSNTRADTCRTSCKLPSCGDGVSDSDEECDDGRNDNNDGCSAECTIEKDWICIISSSVSCKKINSCQDCMNAFGQEFCTKPICEGIVSEKCYSTQTAQISCQSCAGASCSSYDNDSSCFQDRCGAGPCNIQSEQCTKIVIDSGTGDGGGSSGGGGGGSIVPKPKADEKKDSDLITDEQTQKVSLEEGEVGFFDIGVSDSVVLDLYDVLYEVRFEITDRGVLLKVPNGDYLIPRDYILPVLLGGQEMYVGVSRIDAEGAGIVLGLNRELVQEQLAESAVEERTEATYIIIGIIIVILGIVLLAGYTLYRRDKTKKIEFKNQFNMAN